MGKCSVLFTWGANYHGQLGRGTDSTLCGVGTAQVTKELVTWVRCGPGSTVLTTDDGKVLVSSSTTGGRFVADDRLRDVRVVRAASCGPYLVALSADGAVYLVHDRLTKASLSVRGCGLDAGALFAVVWSEDGRVFTMGDNSRGQLGRDCEGGEKGFQLIPKEVEMCGRKVLKVSCGGSHCMCLCSNGEVVGWGSNRFGEVVPGGDDVVRTPTVIDMGDLQVVDLCCGDDTTIFVDGKGKGYVTGRYPSKCSTEPHRLAPLPFTGITSISTGGGWQNSHVLACTGDGVYGMGSNSRGQVTGCTDNEVVADPVRVALPSIDAPVVRMEVAAGWIHSAVLVVTEGTPSICNVDPALGDFTLLGRDVLLLVCSFLKRNALLAVMELSSPIHLIAIDDSLWRSYATFAPRDVHHNFYQYLVDLGKIRREAQTLKGDTGFLRKLLDKLSARKSLEYRFLMIGLGVAGKTTMLYSLKLGRLVTTIPTIGFNVETLETTRGSFTVWDVGGSDKIRPLWRHYYQGSSGVIFVIDSNDRDRVSQAKEELQRVVSEEQLYGRPLLVVANKQDLPHSMTVSELTAALDLQSLRTTPWYIQPCVATRGEGLWEGLLWLADTVDRVSSLSTSSSSS